MSSETKSMTNHKETTTHNQVEGGDTGRQFSKLATALLLVVIFASCAYVVHLTVFDGWLGVAKVWLAWPDLMPNLAVAVVAPVAAWFTKNEFSQTVGVWRVLNAVAFVFSVLLCIVSLLTIIIALILLVLGLLFGEDDDSGGQMHRVRLSRSRSRRGKSHRRRARW